MNAPTLPDQIEHITTAELVPYARNSRTHSPDQIAKVAASIREFGFTNPVLIRDDNTIIAGHGRVMAAQSLELAQVPCIRLGHLSDAQARAYVIADNKLAELAGWDEEMLALELRDLHAAEFDMDLIGFGDDEIAELLAPAGAQGNGDPDAMPATAPDPISVSGDIWQLGTHRLICGDSTDAATIARLMAGGLAHCIWTDPPYNVGYGDKVTELARSTKAKANTVRSGSQILNDSMSAEDFSKFLLAFYRTAIQFVAEGGHLCSTLGDRAHRLYSKFRRGGFQTFRCVDLAQEHHGFWQI